MSVITVKFSFTNQVNSPWHPSVGMQDEDEPGNQLLARGSLSV